MKLIVEKLLILGFVDVLSSSDLVKPFLVNHYARVSQIAVKSETCKNDWTKEKRCRHWKAGSRTVYPNALLSLICMQKHFLQNLLTVNYCWLSEKHFPVSAKCIILRRVSKKLLGQLDVQNFFYNIVLDISYSRH